MTDTLNLSHLIDGERADVARPTESHNPSNTREIVGRTAVRPRSTPQSPPPRLPSRPGPRRRPRCGPTCWTGPALS